MSKKDKVEVGIEYYILDGHKIVKAELLEWAEWFETADRRVARTEMPDGKVISTVFLGLNYAMPWQKAELFETMVFDANGKALDGENTYRYATWEAAEAGHARAIAEHMTAEVIVR